MYEQTCPGPAVVYLIVGLPGAGKTTRAKELEISASALRLTPDEWQILLFGDRNPPDKRDRVEGKLVQVGMRAAELGAPRRSAPTNAALNIPAAPLTAARTSAVAVLCNRRHRI